MSLCGQWIILATWCNEAPWLDEDTELAVDLYCLPLHHTVVPKNRFLREYDHSFSESVHDDYTYSTLFTFYYLNRELITLALIPVVEFGVQRQRNYCVFKMVMEPRARNSLD